MRLAGWICRDERDVVTLRGSAFRGDGREIGIQIGTAGLRLGDGDWT